MLVNLKVRKVKKLHPEDRKKQKEQTNIFPIKKIVNGYEYMKVIYLNCG